MLSNEEAKAIAEDMLVTFVGRDMTDYATMQNFVHTLHKCLQVFRQQGKVVTHDYDATVIFQGVVIDEDAQGAYFTRVWEKLNY